MKVLIITAFILASLGLVASMGQIGRAFSLFNVVQFDNNACRSTSTASAGGTRNGTCYTSDECQKKSGVMNGNCASGFGVCCVFTLQDAGNVVQNNTYIQNPGFATAYAKTAALTYTVKKVSDDVCFLRLDFETFNIGGPAVTDETAGGVCQDSLTITVPGVNPPVICGANAGQHMYLDLTRAAAGEAKLAFAFAAAATGLTRSWDIKVTQLELGNGAKPPAGCTQYFTGEMGQIKSFNFDAPAASSVHLASQNYNVCVRQSAGFCCVEYSVCAAANSWTLTDTGAGIAAGAAANTKFALQDTSCTNDFVEISGSSAVCNGAPIFNRYCGTMLSSYAGGMNVPICDCSAPFLVNVVTDAANDGAAATGSSKGLCLDYRQKPC